MSDAARSSPAGPAAASSAQPAVKSESVTDALYVYQHSNLLYWWPVWVWGYACAALSYFFGIGVRELASGEGKVILFYPEPWLGWSFISVVLFVVLFTNVRARGIYSFVLLGIILLVGWGIPKIPGSDHVLTNWLPLLRIHLNVAFYLTFSILLMLLWLFVVGVVDHFTWVRFSPGQVAEEHYFGQAVGHVYNTEGMVVRRLPDDFFRHRLLGLRLAGLGTGDLLVRPTNGEVLELHNVWRANGKLRRIEQMIATRMTKQQGP